MSKNVVFTIGHHTCKKAINHAYLKDNAPFRSVYDEKQDKLPFLGSGYYFWDNNIEQAIYWGEEHYFGKYNIVEVDLELSGEYFLDLVGSRDDIHFFNGLVARIKKMRKDVNNFSISQYIECLREINRMPAYKGFFESRIIRAVDCHAARQKKMRFNQKQYNSIPLNPRLIICFFSKKDIPLHTIRITK